MQPTRPGPINLILVSIDTLRADHVGVYGYSKPTTPAIDAFARDAVVFRNCFAHAPATLASHASLFTSLLPQHHGASIALESQLAPSATTLTEVLAGAGYQTASFNGGIQLDAAYGLDRGFDVYESVQPRSTRPQTLTGEAVRLASGVERSRAWLDHVQPPFFLFLHSYEIHHPYTPRSRDLAHFRGDYTGPLPDHISMKTLRQVNTGRRRLSKADVAHVVATYDAELRSADAAFGELIEILREKRLYDDTLIVLTSDHGEEFGEHGKMGWHSHTLFDELLHVPLIIRFPGSRWAGATFDAQVRILDVAPTVLSALGLAPPPGYAGQDLLPLFGGEPATDLPLFAAIDNDAEQRPWALRAGRWKFDFRSGRLYDLGTDPHERIDVAANHQEIVSELWREAEKQLGARARPERTPAVPRDETVQQLRELGYVE